LEATGYQVMLAAKRSGWLQRATGAQGIAIRLVVTDLSSSANGRQQSDGRSGLQITNPDLKLIFSRGTRLMPSRTLA